MGLDLLGAPSLVLTRRGGVVPLAIDDHGRAPPVTCARGKHRARRPVNARITYA
jgi:hypothetical protein